MMVSLEEDGHGAALRPQPHHVSVIQSGSAVRLPAGRWLPPDAALDWTLQEAGRLVLLSASRGLGSLLQNSCTC